MTIPFGFPFKKFFPIQPAKKLLPTCYFPARAHMRPFGIPPKILPEKHTLSVSDPVSIYPSMSVDRRSVAILERGLPITDIN